MSLAVLIAILSLYFIVACGVCWLIAFPPARDRVRRAGAALARRLTSGAGRRLYVGKIGTIADGAPAMARLSFTRAWWFIRRHAWLCLLALLLACLPPLAVWLFGDGQIAGLSFSDSPGNAQVTQLLAGEQLTAPLALPPLLFATEEAQAARPLLAGASRDWQLLSPDFSHKLLTAFKIMKEQYGYDMALLEGYRSPERQHMLASLGPQVTNAGAFQSFHQYGRAADCAFLRNGVLVISEKDPWAMAAYRRYGEVAETLGLHWGGRWAMRDFGHAELRPPAGTKKTS